MVRKKRADAGKSRPHYDNSRRERVSNEREFSKMLEKHTDENIKPFSNYRTGKSRRERRSEEREDLIPTDRKCPICGLIKLRSRQWVLTKDFTGCKSCHSKELQSKNP